MPAFGDIGAIVPNAIIATVRMVASPTTLLKFEDMGVLLLDPIKISERGVWTARPAAPRAPSVAPIPAEAFSPKDPLNQLNGNEQPAYGHFPDRERLAHGHEPQAVLGQ